MPGSGQGRLTRILQDGQMGEDEDLGRNVVESAITAQHLRSAAVEGERHRVIEGMQ